MKSVLISNRPKWCGKICHEIGKDENGKPIYEKRIEVRKTAPKEVPFKAYIYCTKDRRNLLPIEHGKVLQKVNFWENTDAYYGFGKVIGEFICDEVEEFHEWELSPQGKFADFERERLENFLTAACLSEEEVVRYRENLPYFKLLYGWHISDLKIYDKPKKLSEFFVHKKVKGGCENCAYYRTPTLEFCQDCKSGKQPKKYLTSPPQSWMYVEEIETR